MTNRETYRGQVFVKNLSRDDLLYLAGFMDGEGCISRNKDQCFQLLIYNTDRDIIEWVQKTVGTGSIHENHRKNTTHKTLYSWRLGRLADIESFLTQIAPFLKIKKEKAKLTLTVVSQRLDSGYGSPLSSNQKTLIEHTTE